MCIRVHCTVLLNFQRSSFMWEYYVDVWLHYGKVCSATTEPVLTKRPIRVPGHMCISVMHTHYKLRSCILYGSNVVTVTISMQVIGQ